MYLAAMDSAAVVGFGTEDARVGLAGTVSFDRVPNSLTLMPGGVARCGDLDAVVSELYGNARDFDAIDCSGVFSSCVAGRGDVDEPAGA